MRILLHAVYEFDPPKGSPVGRVFLDCFTGFPTTFVSSKEKRLKFCNAERQDEIAKFDAGARCFASQELAKIEAEKCYTLFWQIDNVRSTIDQHVDVLQELKRPNSKAEWKVAREIGWRYHPSEKPLEVAA